MSLSPQARIVLRRLSKAEKAAIQIKGQRNAILWRLRREKVPRHILCELSGLSKSSVSRIASAGVRESSIAEMEALMAFRRLFNRFYKASVRTLKKEGSLS